MRAIPICWLVAFLSCVTPLWAGDSWESAGKEAVLKADWRSVAEIAQEWKQREPDSIVAHWLAGYAGLATGDYRLATDGFGRLDKPEGFSQLQDWAAALAVENPRSAVPLMLQGDALARSGKYDEALALLDKAVSLDQRAALIYNTRGVVKALANRPQEAMVDFTEATRLSPQFADAYTNQGLLHLVQGEHQQAIANFSAAIEHAPDFALAYHGRGIARLQTNDYDGALTDLERTGQLPSFGSNAWLETNRQSVLREQARFTLQQHLADLRSGHPGNDSMSFNYDNHGNLTSLRDVFGGETRYGYDPAGRLSRITYPDGKWTEYRYYDNGYLREMLTESGRRIRYTHGAKGEWTRIEFPNKDTLRIEQNPSARSVTFSFPDGDTTRYQFDQQQRLVEVRSADLTRTSVYESSGQLRQIKWSDGRTVDFQSDTASQIRSIRDQTGQEMRQWEVTLRADERGRVTTVTDPLERTRLQWDNAGRLRSATSDSGAKVLVHWDSETNKPRSLTTSWGYIEFDDRGRPQDLYTIEGQRWPATWKADGQLEQIMTPLFGAVRFRYETPDRPIAVQFPDGLSTALDWEKKDLARTRDMQFAQRDLENVRFREPPRPLSSTRFNEERSWQYRFEMPQFPADRFVTAHSGRFWSRVQELVEQSARLPMPSEQDLQRPEEYWTKGEYWAKDPYYADLARPMPEFSAESYFKAFVLTTGVIASDWARFALQIVPGPKIDPAIDFLIKPLVERIPVPAHNSLMQQLKAVDPNGDITRGLDVASKRLHKVGELVGNLRFIHAFLQNSFSSEPWSEAKNYNPNTGQSLIVLTGRTPWTITTQSSVSRFTKYTSGYTVSVTPLRALETTLEKVAEKTFGMALDTGLETPTSGKILRAPSRNTPSSPVSFQVLSLRVDQATGKVTQM